VLSHATPNKPETLRLDSINAMLLNEFLKEQSYRIALHFFSQ